jgi:histidinol-phosphate aminotransferase
MGNAIDRRDWLKRSSLALAGLGLSTQFPMYRRHPGYLPGDPILLNSNENPYGPSPMARKAIMEAYVHTNRYPDDLLPVLKKKIASHWNVGAENILLGAGSSEIIGLACQMASQQKGHVITGEPSYKVWNNQAASFGLEFKRVPLNGEKKLDLAGMVDAINQDTRMVYFCNPNNPTGTFVDPASLSSQALKVKPPVLAFIDEAYTEFAELDSLAPIAVKNKNIIVAKTFSKIYGLAGARVGYAIAHPDTIRSLASYQAWPDASVSMVSAAAAMASLDDLGFVKECRDKIRASREMCFKTFKELSLDYIPSSTNFILFNIDKLKGDFTNELQGKGIYTQFREHFGGKWCRVTMGTAEEMEAFLKALKEMAVA